MVHSENSKMINDYIELYQKGTITLEGLWYNIQTPLHILFEKEERLQVQEKRNQEQEKRIQRLRYNEVIKQLNEYPDMGWRTRLQVLKKMRGLWGIDDAAAFVR